MSELYPFVIEPLETPAIWGGDALVRHFGKPGDPNAKLGESWECWDLNRIGNGAFAGATIADLRQSLGPKLLGNLDPRRIFPILTKIIDARDWLSVQVHPNDAYAQRVEAQPFGKTECWHIFSAEPGSELVLGWARDTTREEYERRVADGTLGEILRRIPVKAGDTYYLPAGTLHAIGSGIVLFEAQQASDLTYRIFDWNRVGSDGKPRDLHVSKAADVLDYHRGTRGPLTHLDYQSGGLARTALVADPNFVMERIVATSEPASLATEDRPLIVMALDRPLELNAGELSVTLEAYQTALIPAAAEWCAMNARDGVAAPFMCVTPPMFSDSLSVRLLAAGIDAESIDRFMAQFV